MIPHGVEVFVGLEPIDLRWGFNRLAGLVTERLGRDARSRALFVFFGKRRDALKVLFFDGTGLCLFYNETGSPPRVRAGDLSPGGQRGSLDSAWRNTTTSSRSAGVRITGRVSCAPRP